MTFCKSPLTQLSECDNSIARVHKMLDLECKMKQEILTSHKQETLSLIRETWWVDEDLKEIRCRTLHVCNSIHSTPKFFSKCVWNLYWRKKRFISFLRYCVSNGEKYRKLFSIFREFRKLTKIPRFFFCEIHLVVFSIQRCRWSATERRNEPM